MADLVVRDLDTHLVETLKERAARHGRSVEAEHRAILEQALLGLRRRTLAEVLAVMPDVGQDSDFERIDDPGQTDVFD